MFERVNIFIIYSKLIDEARKLIIGGAEKYIVDLSELLSGAGYNVFVCQFTAESFKEKFRNFNVIGVNSRGSVRDILAYIDKSGNVNYERDILIFGTDFTIAPNKFRHVIAIQHGIAWDDADFIKASALKNYASAFKSALRSIVKTYRYRYCNELVCVDYNFINWYRTQVKAIPFYPRCIPNYAEVPAFKPEKSSNTTSIVFARRLIFYRGTRLFADAATNILSKYPDITITIAGEGYDEEYMREKLGRFTNVIFTSYSAENSVKFHSKYDIAVVPTVQHEGTSLSLLEAMAAGCAVIASNIGGMSNIIIDGYNGLMINPIQSELEEAIGKLIVSSKLRQKLSDNGYQTVKEGFSFEKWSEKWLTLIGEVSHS